MVGYPTPQLWRIIQDTRAKVHHFLPFLEDLEPSLFLSDPFFLLALLFFPLSEFAGSEGGDCSGRLSANHAYLVVHSRAIVSNFALEFSIISAICGFNAFSAIGNAINERIAKITVKGEFPIRIVIPTFCDGYSRSPAIS